MAITICINTWSWVGSNLMFGVSVLAHKVVIDGLGRLAFVECSL